MNSPIPNKEIEYEVKNLLAQKKLQVYMLSLVKYILREK